MPEQFDSSQNKLPAARVSGNQQQQHCRKMALATAPPWHYGAIVEMNHNHFCLSHPPPPPASPCQVQPQVSKADDEVEWNTALCECDDAASCCFGFWCVHCLACSVSWRLQEAFCLPLCDVLSCVASLFSHVPMLVPPAAFGLRVAIRKKYKIRGSLLGDMAVSSCCSWCSWCQMYRELKHRMRDPCVVSARNVVSVQPPPLAPAMKMDQNVA